MIKNTIKTGLLVAILTISQLSAMDQSGITKVKVEFGRDARAKFGYERALLSMYQEEFTAKEILDEVADRMGDPEVSDQLSLWQRDERGNLDRVMDAEKIDSVRLKKTFVILYDRPQQ